MTTLKIEQIKKNYGRKQVLKGIDLTLQNAKIYALLGRNGVGKSTLMRLIAGQSLPTSGSITLDGQPVFENAAALNQVFLMSALMLYPANQKVGWAFRTTQMLYPDFDLLQAEKLARQFQLSQKARIRSLSTGYQTIMKAIIALCVPCDFIFLDEPVLGLDAANRELFYQALLDSYNQNPRTIVIATHLIEEISSLVEQVVVIDQGVVSLNETSETLREKGRILSGPKAQVAAATAGLQVLHQSVLGGMETAYVLGQVDPQNLPEGVSATGMDLQRLFIELTAREDSDEA